MTGMGEFWSTSHTTGGNSSYLENLFESYLDDPASVPTDWRNYFDSLNNGSASNGKDISHAEVVKRFKNKSPILQKNHLELINKQYEVFKLIDSYRQKGHFKANLDPLKLEQPNVPDELSYTFYDLDENDLNRSFNFKSSKGSKNSSLKDIIEFLETVYCSTVGYEFKHICEKEIIDWFIEKLERDKSPNSQLSNEEKIYILKRLGSAEGLAKFLSSRYPGMKRFGIEGAESLIPLVDSLIQNCGISGAEQICFGMAHRGRLNLLVNVLGKPPTELFSEFEEDFELTGDNTGDVKYHLGVSSNILTPNGEVHVSLNNNPSHLEIVDPVIIGSVRARQDRLGDTDREKVVPILIHGDASFSGQGVVMETLQMSQTRAYGVGGTIHIIVNNQIGFTTSNKSDARSTHYASDVAKMIEAPIIHVNADDPESIIFASKLATDFRYKFKRDVIIDMVCFRRRGHNETDDPSQTQPVMYQAVANHPGIKNIYQNQLISTGIITESECKEIEKKYRSTIEEGKSVAHNLATKPNEKVWFDWTKYWNATMNQDWRNFQDTSFNQHDFKKLGKEILDLPDNFSLQKPVKKLIDDRLKMNNGEMPINWGFAETMAYATLLSEGYPIRLTGQDVRRGTFSHRHSVIFNKDDGSSYIPLLSVANKNNARVEIYDSLLSEEAVLGFEYGYSATWPTGLVIWEAQFGDFVNGAQVVIDQFIVSAEHKWERLSGLVMLLPHGYEGQGPEHSSARLERFLQLCANENIQVCVPSTPAQIYHLLRQQCKRDLRKPLIVLSPKSLLRNPEAVSSLNELTDGSYKLVLTDDHKKNTKIKKVVMCSGKIYYDLLKKKKEINDEEVSFVRLEQLYPFPYDELENALMLFPKAKEFIWCQEEPMNQGAWFSHRHRIQRVMDRLNIKNVKLVSRPAAAAPAVGLNKMHNMQQEFLINEVFNTIDKNGN